MNARSERTRARLLAVTRDIIERDGYRPLTISAVAAEAGVTRRAVYLHFDSLGDLLAALFGHVAETEGLTHSVQRVHDAGDGFAALRAWAAHLADYHVRLLPLSRAITEAARDDPHAAAHMRRVVRAQRSTCRHIVRRLADEGILASTWTQPEAVDMLWALISNDLIGGLAERRRWSRGTLERRLGDLFVRTFTVGRRSDDCDPGLEWPAGEAPG